MFRKLQAPLRRLFNRRGSKKDNASGDIGVMNAATLYNTNITHNFVFATPKHCRSACSSSFISLTETPKARPRPYVEVKEEEESIYEIIENIEQDDRLREQETTCLENFPFHCDTIKRRLIFIEAKLYQTKRQIRKGKSRSNNRSLPQHASHIKYDISEKENEFLTLMKDRSRTRRELRYALQHQELPASDNKEKHSYKLYPCI